MATPYMEVAPRPLRSDNGSDRAAQMLLDASDPPPFRIENPGGLSPLLFTCDHASNAVPRCLKNLGLESVELQRHIGWDIGAAEITVALARRFDAKAILSGYSRLVIDCNRAPGLDTSILEVSDGTQIPGNLGLGSKDAEGRAEAVFHPYHEAVSELLDNIRQSGSTPIFVAIHSFTPKLNNGQPRPWHLGVLWDEDPRIAVPLIRELRKNHGVLVGDNEPYSGRDHFDFSQPYHACRNNIPSALIEVRDDLIRDQGGLATWIALLGDALEAATANLDTAHD